MKEKVDLITSHIPDLKVVLKKNKNEFAKVYNDIFFLFQKNDYPKLLDLLLMEISVIHSEEDEAVTDFLDEKMQNLNETQKRFAHLQSKKSIARFYLADKYLHLFYDGIEWENIKINSLKKQICFLQSKGYTNQIFVKFLDVESAFSELYKKYLDIREFREILKNKIQIIKDEKKVKRVKEKQKINLKQSFLQDSEVLNYILFFICYSMMLIYFYDFIMSNNMIYFMSSVIFLFMPLIIRNIVKISICLVNVLISIINLIICIPQIIFFSCLDSYHATKLLFIKVDKNNLYKALPARVNKCYEFKTIKTPNHDKNTIIDAAFAIKFLIAFVAFVVIFILITNVPIIDDNNIFFAFLLSVFFFSLAYILYLTMSATLGKKDQEFMKKTFILLITVASFVFAFISIM